MRYDHYESGTVYAIRYEFRAGEKLPSHAHVGETADQAHNIVVLAGRIAFDGQPCAVLRAGHVFDFDNEHPHSVLALTDAVTVHLMLYGKPASFAGYTDAQRHGET
jgi:hypothetical protein